MSRTEDEERVGGNILRLMERIIKEKRHIPPVLESATHKRRLFILSSASH